MTEKQERYFNFIKDYMEKNKKSPTYKEIAKHFNVTIPTVQEYIIILEKKGLIIKAKYDRSITINNGSKEYWKVKYFNLLEDYHKLLKYKNA